MFVCQLFYAVFLFLCHVTLSLNTSSSQLPKGYVSHFPATRFVGLNFYTVNEENQVAFEEAHTRHEPGVPTRFQALLRRRNDIDLYGRKIVHSDDEANYAKMVMLMPEEENHIVLDQYHEWDGTQLVKAQEGNCLGSGKTCFIAMNRFDVKEDCESLFEQRWAKRQSKLSSQPGFLGFSLLRKKNRLGSKAPTDIPFTYSTCTIWSSYKTWTQWRSGEGRSSHDASRSVTRTPTSEWLNSQASPIYWDGLETVLAQDGI